MGFKKGLDYSMIFQSIPSLLISLIGVTLSGKKLDSEQTQEFATKYPILLLSNCMLTFKGNAELIFALHLSSFSQVKNLKFSKYLKYAFDNSCLVLAQSIVIGLTIGLLGFSRNVVLNIADAYFLCRILFICLFSAFISSFVIISILIPAVIIAVKLRINPDNIVLPVISSFGDFFDIIVLVYTIQKFQNIKLVYAGVLLFLILALLPFLVYVSVYSNRRVPLQSFSILLITYLLSSSSSYAIQFLSKWHLLLASSTPIFCGLTVSITYIYLNKRITALQNSTPINKNTCFLTLLATSILIGSITAAVMPLIGIKTKRIFSILFIIGFMLSVCVLLRIVEIIVRFFIEDVENLGVVSVPLITSIADFIGSTIIISTSIVVYGLN